MQAPPTPEITGELALMLALRLGVSPLNRASICHGYQHGCDCAECSTRAESRSRQAAQARQPWQAAA